MPSGYQKLCGQRALDYVRYRHLDSDLVRAARQQSFLGQAKDQIGVSGVFSDRRTLLRIFARSVRTDIRSSRSILSLLKLVAESSSKPVAEVQFPALDAGDGSGNVVISDRTSLHATVERFLDVARDEGRSRQDARVGRREARRAARAARPARRARRDRDRARPRRRPRRRRGRGGAPAGQAAVAAGLRPAPAATGGRYRTDYARAYTIADRGGQRHRAYRIVAFEGSIGQYYGVAGHDLEGAADPRRPLRAPPHRAAARTSCSTTAAGCASSRGARRARCTGSRTRCCAR